MIVDLTQNKLEKQLSISVCFSDPINVAKALAFAKRVLPMYYDIIKTELKLFMNKK